MNIPSGTTINWFASNNGGATWEPMSIQTTREIDQEWTEYTLTRNFTDPNGNKVRYKAEMSAPGSRRDLRGVSPLSGDALSR
jgi:hypothetical protein